MGWDILNINVGHGNCGAVSASSTFLPCIGWSGLENLETTSLGARPSGEARPLVALEWC